jgi:hypothetical protein
MPGRSPGGGGGPAGGHGSGNKRKHEPAGGYSSGSGSDEGASAPVDMYRLRRKQVRA